MEIIKTIKLISQGCEKTLKSINQEIEKNIRLNKDELINKGVNMSTLVKPISVFLKNHLDKVLQDNMELVFPKEENLVPYIKVGDKILIELMDETLTNSKIIDNFTKQLDETELTAKEYITEQLNSLNLNPTNLGEAVEMVGDMLHNALLDTATGDMFNTNRLFEAYKLKYNSLPNFNLDNTSTAEQITHVLFPFIMEAHYDYLIKNKKIKSDKEGEVKGSYSIAIGDIVENDVAYDDEGNVIDMEEDSTNNVRNDLFFKSTEPPKISKLVKFILSRLNGNRQDPTKNIIDLFKVGDELTSKNYSEFIQYIQRPSKNDLDIFLNQLVELSGKSTNILNNKPKQLLLALGSYALSNVKTDYIEAVEDGVSVSNLHKDNDIVVILARVLEGGDSNQEVKDLKKLLENSDSTIPDIIKELSNILGVKKSGDTLNTVDAQSFKNAMLSAIENYNIKVYLEKINNPQVALGGKSLGTLLYTSLSPDESQVTLTSKGLDGKQNSKFIKPNGINTFNKTLAFVKQNEFHNPLDIFNNNPFYTKEYKVENGSFLLKGNKPSAKSTFFNNVDRFNLLELTDIDYKLYKQGIFRPNVQSDAPNPQYVEILGIKKFDREGKNLNRFISQYSDFVGKYVATHSNSATKPFNIESIKNENLRTEIQLALNVYNAGINGDSIILNNAIAEYSQYLLSKFELFNKYINIISNKYVFDAKDFWFATLQVHYFMQPFLGGDIIQYAHKADPITEMVKRSRESGGYTIMVDDTLLPESLISINLSKVQSENAQLTYHDGKQENKFLLDGQTFLMPHSVIGLQIAQGGDFQQLISDVRSNDNLKLLITGLSEGAMMQQKESEHIISPAMINMSSLYKQMYQASLNIKGEFKDGELKPSVIDFGKLKKEDKQILNNTIGTIFSNQTEIIDKIKALFDNKQYNTLLELDTKINDIINKHNKTLSTTINYESIFLITALGHFKELKTNQRMVHQFVPPDSRKSNTEKWNQTNISISKLEDIARDGIDAMNIINLPLNGVPSRNIYIQQNPNHNVGHNAITLMTQLVSSMVYQKGNSAVELKGEIAKLFDLLKKEIPLLSDDKAFMEIDVNDRKRKEKKSKKTTEPNEEIEVILTEEQIEEQIKESVNRGRDIVLRQVLSDLIASRDNLSMEIELSANNALTLVNSPKYTTLLSNQINAFINKILKPKLNGDIFVLREGTDLVFYKDSVTGKSKTLQGIKLEITTTTGKGKNTKQVKQIINPIDVEELTTINAEGKKVLKQGDDYMRSFQEYLDANSNNLRVIPHEIALPLDTFKKHFSFVEQGVDLDKYDLDYFTNHYRNKAKFIRNENDLKKFLEDNQEDTSKLSEDDFSTISEAYIEYLQTDDKRKLYDLINSLSLSVVKFDYTEVAQRKFNDFQKLRRTIITRIPTTGKHSGGVAIVKTLVDVKANTVFVPQELLDIQGADLDVDKGVTPLYSFGKGEKDIVMNNILDIMYNELLTPTTFLESIRPVSTQDIKQTANAVIKILQIKEEQGTITELEKNQKFLLTNDRGSMYWLFTNLLLNIQGKGQVGIFATGQKVYAGIMMAIRNLETQMQSQIEGFTIENFKAGMYDDMDIVKRYNKLHPNTTLYLPYTEVNPDGSFNIPDTGILEWRKFEINRWGNTDNPNDIMQVWLNLSALVNASTDNAKDPMLSIIGSTPDTSPLVASLSMLGGLPKSYLLLFSDSEIVNIFNEYKKSRFNSFDKFYKYAKYDQIIENEVNSPLLNLFADQFLEHNEEDLKFYYAKKKEFTKDFNELKKELKQKESKKPEETDNNEETEETEETILDYNTEWTKIVDDNYILQMVQDTKNYHRELILEVLNSDISAIPNIAKKYNVDESKLLKVFIEIQGKKQVLKEEVNAKLRKDKLVTLYNLSQISKQVRTIGQILGINQGLNYRELENKQLIKETRGLKNIVNKVNKYPKGIITSTLVSSPDMFKAWEVALLGDEIRKQMNLTLINIQNKIFNDLPFGVKTDSLPTIILEKLVINYLNSKEAINTGGTSHRKADFINKFPSELKKHIRTVKASELTKRLKLDSESSESDGSRNTILQIKNHSNIPSFAKLSLVKEFQNLDNDYQTNLYYYNLIVNKDLFGKNKLTELFSNSKFSLEFAEYISTQITPETMAQVETDVKSIYTEAKKKNKTPYPSPVKDIVSNIKQQSKSTMRNRAISKVITELVTRLADKYAIKVIQADSETLGRLGIKNTIAGMVKDNVIYINTDYMGADTPLHEFIHIYFAVLKESNPQAYADVMAEVQKIPEIQRMIDKKTKEGYTQSDVVEEAVVEILGRNMVNELQDRSWYRKIIDYVNSLFRMATETDYKKNKLYLKDLLSAVKTEFESDEFKIDYHIALKEQKTDRGLYTLTGKDLSTSQGIDSIISRIEHEDRYAETMREINTIRKTQHIDHNEKIRELLVKKNLMNSNPIDMVKKVFKEGTQDNEAISKALYTPDNSTDVELKSFQVEGYPEVLAQTYERNGIKLVNFILPTQSNLVLKSFGTLFNKHVVDSKLYNTNRDAGYTALYLSSLEFLKQNPEYHASDFRVLSLIKGSNNEMIHNKEAIFVKKEFDKIYYKTNGKIDDKIKDKLSIETQNLLAEVNEQRLKVPYIKMYSNLLGNQTRTELKNLIDGGVPSKAHLNTLKDNIYYELKTTSGESKDILHRVLLELQNVETLYSNGLNVANAWINNPSSFVAPLLQHLSSLANKMMTKITDRFFSEYKNKQDNLRIKMLQVMSDIIPELKGGAIKGYREYDKYLWEKNKNGNYTGRIINPESTPLINPEQWKTGKVLWANKDVRNYIEFITKSVERYYNEAFADNGKSNSTYTTMIADDIRKGENANYLKYQLPIIDGKLAQLVFNSDLSVTEKLKMGFGKIFANMNDSGVVVEDINKPHNISDIELKNMFLGQIYPTSRNSLLGLDNPNSKEAFRQNQDIELNLESVVGFFAVTQIRTHEYFKNRYDYEAVETVLLDQATSGQGETSLELRVVKELFYQTILTDTKMLNRTDDMILNKGLDFLGRTTSFLSLSGDLFAGLANHITAQWNLISIALKNSLFKADGLFGLKEFFQAHLIMAGVGINNTWENTRKIWGSLNKSQYHELNKIDLLFKHFRLLDMDYNKVIGNGNMMSGNLLHELPYLALQAGDYYNKGLFMVATMLKDGSWNAYSVVENKDGDFELKYNPAKDKRFNKPDGELLKDYLKREGRVDDKGNLTSGYSDDMMMKIRKIASDAFGTFSKEEQAIAQNYAFGRFLMIFRRWILPKLTRYYGGRTQNFIHYGNLHKVKDENGIEKLEWNGSFNEGLLLSMLSYSYNVFDNRGDIVKAWGDLNQVQKDNVKAMGVNSLMMISLVALLMSMFDEEERKKGKGISRYLWDTMIDFRLMLNPYDALELFSNPSVAFSYIKQFLSMLGFIIKAPIDMAGINVLTDKEWKRGGETTIKFFSNPFPLVGDYMKLKEFQRGIEEFGTGTSFFNEPTKSTYTNKD